MLQAALQNMYYRPSPFSKEHPPCKWHFLIYHSNQSSASFHHLSKVYILLDFTQNKVLQNNFGTKRYVIREEN